MEYSSLRFRRSACFVAVLLLLGAATGCGKGKVSGTVKGPDGQPLPLGRIIFSPSGGPAVAADIEDGKYAAQNVPAGEVKVSLETKYVKEQADQTLQNSGVSQKSMPPVGGTPKDMPPAAVAQMEEIRRKQAEGLEHAKDQLAKYREMPEKYTNPQNSGLGLTVKGGDNIFNVDLSSK